jgi:hypothetical protein
MNRGLHQRGKSMRFEHAARRVAHESTKALLHIDSVKESACVVAAATIGKELLDFTHGESRCAARVVALHVRAAAGIWFVHVRDPVRGSTTRWPILHFSKA